MKLLIVDATEHSRGSLASFLGLHDWLEVVGEATSAVEAFSLAKLHNPDVVIMDVNLPDVDVFWATRHMLAKNPAPAIVLLTVHYWARESRRANEAGAAAYIEKSAGVDAVLETLRALSENQTRRINHV